MGCGLQVTRVQYALVKKNLVKTSLIILTRNEIAGVHRLLGQIPFESVDEYFAVDYDSHDGTVEYFMHHHIPVLHQVKRGRAEAFRLGAQAARGDILIFFSPDGNEDPHDIPPLIQAVRNGADLAIASRFIHGARNEEDDKHLKFRKWANQGFTYAANLFFRRHAPKITDTINGYRAITKRAFESLHLNAEGFAIEYQMTMRALKKGLTISEIPTHEGNRVGGKSGSAAVPTGISFLWYLLLELV